MLALTGLSSTSTVPRSSGSGVTDLLHSLSDRVFGSKPAPAPPPDPAPHYTSDPTLDHNQLTCDPQLSEQRLVGPCQTWDGARILNAQSQLETGEPATANNQESRCGPSAVLGTAIMQGPEATAGLADRLAGQVDDRHTKSAISDIGSRLRDGSATHEDLSHLQQAMYDQYHIPGADPGLTADDMTAMEQDLCPHVDVAPQQDETTPQG
ncbi:MAG TPA: hypothetical protein VGO93_13550, partial [Candidatus Xenobia bacterium]